MILICKHLWVLCFAASALILGTHAQAVSTSSEDTLDAPPQEELQYREEEAVAFDEADDDDDSDEIASEMEQGRHVIGMPNPASVNCTKKGGVLKEEAKPNGDKFSVCYFNDGGQCEVWALLRRECRTGGVKVSDSASQEARYCAIIGGSFVPGWQSAAHITEEAGTCHTPRGVTVSAQSLWNGKQQLTMKQQRRKFSQSIHREP
jgi:putative hemolysin